MKHTHPSWTRSVAPLVAILSIAGCSDATGPEARFPYPEWEQLRPFTPSERRLILDYFRRLNEVRRRP